MFSVTVTPRFGDTDALGHINNTALPGWFELARNPLFAMFPPERDFTDGTFSLIMAHTDFDFLGELVFGAEVEIRSWVSRIGTKSFTILHEAWQKGELRCRGHAVIVHYNFKTRETLPLPEDKKAALARHLRRED
ncbi:MAG: acyl-CoA thioesterase [Treponema sp.]|jgi:acyl-CoA thioester hydrolase|nr:acyl-CoA thioesterase [Treponema sp.]